MEKARKKGYKISRVERFRYRCRYFTDSGVIGGPVKSCLRQGVYDSFHQASKDFPKEIKDHVNLSNIEVKITGFVF